MNKKLTKIYETDASQIKGNALEVFTPETVEGVQEVVRLNPKITIRGGATGLVGGAVPQNDVVLDLSKLIKIENLDTDRKTVEVGAGVILDDLQTFLEDYNLEFPVKPSSHAVCTIGGMIATDAVGGRAIKYGKTSDSVRWIDVVDSKGEVSRKGATELTDYVGLEGITGVIVRACLNLSSKVSRTASLVNVEEISQLPEIVSQLKRNSSVSMIEFVDKKISPMIGLGEGYHVIVEYESSAGLLSGDEYDHLLSLRDSIYPILAKEGYSHIEDPKIRLDRFEKLMSWLESKEIPVFGHLGVGILHPCFNESQKKLIPEMMDLVMKLGGQVSGEHGIGLTKRNYVEINDQKILRNVKKRTDVENKFNVGKVI